VLLIDKTGTITYGNRMANEIIAADRIAMKHLAEVALAASYGDDTPEGRSILQFINTSTAFTCLYR